MHHALARSLPALALLALGAVAPAHAFDKVLMRDGRLIEGKLLSDGSDGTVILRLPGADIPIPMAIVDKVYVEDLEEYVPKNKTEEEHLKKGRVLFEGSWMSRTRRESILEKRREEQEEALERSKKEHDWRNHKTVETRHFVIKSNCTDEVIEEYGELLEDYYKSFVESWAIKRDPSERSQDMTVYFYRTKDDFHRDTGKPTNISGFFSFPNRELRLYYDLGDADETRRVLFHEGNHMLTYLVDTGFGYPTWMSEGLAEYYGSARVAGGGRFELGDLQYGRIVSLRNDEANGEVLGLREVMMTAHEDFNARHYAVAWSIVHYLMESETDGETFRGFFKNLPKNRGLDITNRSYSNVTGALAEPSLESVCEALEAELGRSIEELETAWRAHQAQAYTELDAEAYYEAARIALRNPLPGDAHVNLAMEHFAKAVELEIGDPACFREYSAVLRVGGLDDRSQVALVAEPDPATALAMIERAVGLDPVDPLNYFEAAEVLFVGGDTQDLDRAHGMVLTAQALAPNDLGTRLVANRLLSQIEPLRQEARLRAEIEAERIANDQRVWTIQPYFVQGEATPDQLAGLSTQDLRELILAGAVTGRDWAFQSFQYADPDTGELVPGEDPWDKDWVLVAEIDVFADELAQVAEGG